MKVVMLPASELVEDFDLYPRKDVDSLHIASLAEAVASGEELPPIVAGRKCKRITDGWHRRRAYIRVHGETAQVPVTLKDYKNDAEMFLDAVRLNSGHGRRLTAIDAVRAATKGKAFGLDEVTIARALRMSIERVADLVVDRTARTATGPIAIKRTIRHMAGKKLTKPQEQANGRLSGMNPSFYVNQLIDLLENDLLPVDDPRLEERLRKLHGLLDAHVGAAA